MGTEKGMIEELGRMTLTLLLDRSTLGSAILVRVCVCVCIHIHRAEKPPVKPPPKHCASPSCRSVGRAWEVLSRMQRMSSASANCATFPSTILPSTLDHRSAALGLRADARIPVGSLQLPFFRRARHTLTLCIALPPSPI